jgi:hypothetical protein
VKITTIVVKAAQAFITSSDHNDLKEDTKMKECQEVANHQDIITIDTKIAEMSAVKETTRECHVHIEMVNITEAVVYIEEDMEDTREEYVKV